MAALTLLTLSPNPLCWTGILIKNEKRRTWPKFSINLSLAISYSVAILHRGNSPSWRTGERGVESLKKGKNGSNVRKRTIKQKRRIMPLCPLFVSLVLETWKISDKPHIFTGSFPSFANPPIYEKSQIPPSPFLLLSGELIYP